MGNFNRDRGGRPGGGRGFSSKGGPSSGWERRGPVEMHQATCDKCQKSCEVPFRPTSGKPIFCSNCFSSKGGSAYGGESNRGSDSRPSYGREDRQMFDATCDECRNRCQVPFQPSGGKPVYCSNCFGDKKEGGNRNRESSQPQYQGQFEQLNSKLDQILTMLAPKEIKVQSEEQVIDEVKTKVAKKKPSKKK